MNTPQKIVSPPDEQKMVYVRAVGKEDLPEDLQGHALGRDKIYAVHAANGERLALVKDRELAFVLARQNDLSPVNVH